MRPEGFFVDVLFDAVKVREVLNSFAGLIDGSENPTINSCSFMVRLKRSVTSLVWASATKARSG